MPAEVKLRDISYDRPLAHAGKTFRVMAVGIDKIYRHFRAASPSARRLPHMQNRHIEARHE